MTTTIDAKFAQSLKCLEWHIHPELGDRDSLDAFNRLLAKNVKPSGSTKHTHLDIQPHQISSRNEQWSTEKLATLARGHAYIEGDDFDCPIIIAEYEAVQRVLDGNHRINRWIKDGDTRLHEVNIHTISGLGHPMELPARGRATL